MEGVERSGDKYSLVENTVVPGCIQVPFHSILVLYNTRKHLLLVGDGIHLPNT